MKYTGNQSFEVGVTLKHIAECVKEWNAENYEQYNNLTRIHGGTRIFAPMKYANGVNGDMIKEIWGVTQAMDRASYDALNWMLTGVCYFILPPPPPPPPPGEG